MQKGSFANEDVMEDYLSALLTEPDDLAQRQSVADLLKDAQARTLVQTPISTPEEPKEVVDLVQEKEVQADIDQQVPQLTQAREALEQGEFQALFFEVAGLTLAVPLTQLGGIHQIEKIEPLFGKPNWFMGLMLHRDEKLKAVDSAKWVMPEKYNEKLAESLNYQYLIMLDESGWGLSCETLITTATLQPDDVKWRKGESKRPWLAGMVKEKMCALIDVEQIVAMLNKGLGSND